MSENILPALAGSVVSFYLLSKAGAAKTAPEQMILQGTYNGYGNIYSPEIVDNKMYFSGWYSDEEYPHDAIYVTDLNDITNVKKLLQFEEEQIGDPTIVGDSMYMTFSPDPLDLTKHKISVSKTYDGGNTWSMPEEVIDKGWLSSVILTDNLYAYYTYADLVTNQLRRAQLDMNNQIVETFAVIFDTPDFYPINIDVKYYDNLYYLLGDYWAAVDGEYEYCIGLWVSEDGINFTEYINNPIIIPSNDNIIARTPFFKKEGNKLKIWYAQQKEDWWTNTLFYTEKEIIME